MTGLDFSEAALDVGRRLAADTCADVDFVQADVYDAVDVLGGLVTSISSTPASARCAGCPTSPVGHVVAQLLRAGGRVFVREGHPVLWSLDDTRTDGLFVVEYPYFEKRGTLFSEPKTYVEHDGDIASPDSVGFNHGLGQIITALQDAGMTFTSLEEHMSLPWNAAGDAMVVDELGEWSLRDQPERLAGTYTLQAAKPS